MKSQDKLEVTVKRMYGKRWMQIRPRFKDGTLIPSFHDWFRMIQALKYCEALKYQNVADPYDVPRRFFMRCFDEGVTWEELRREFNIPDRSKP